jgi:hypothetical protein
MRGTGLEKEAEICATNITNKTKRMSTHANNLESTLKCVTILIVDTISEFQQTTRVYTTIESALKLRLFRLIRGTVSH